MHHDAPATTTDDKRRKLTDYEYARIRKLYESGSYSYADLGLMFGVSSTCIGWIVKGRKPRRKNG